MTPTQDLAPATGCHEFVPASAAKPQTKPLLCMSPTGTETNVSQTTADTSTLKIGKHGNFAVAKDFPQISQFEVSVPPPNTPFASPADLKTITNDKIVGESSVALRSLRMEKAVQSVGSMTANFGTQTC